MSVIVTLLLAASVAVNVWLLRRRPNRGRSADRSALLQGIENIKDLATIRQGFQSIVMFEDSRSLLGVSLPGTGRKFILKYSGTITCGNDLSKIQISERFAVNQVRMAVPHSELLHIYPDMESIKVYDQRAGLFASINLSDQNREIASDLKEVRSSILKGDILLRADENTRKALVSFAASLGMEAEVVFGDPEEPGTLPQKIPEGVPLQKTTPQEIPELALQNAEAK